MTTEPDAKSAWVKVRDAVEGFFSKGWQDIQSALKKTWEAISPELAQFASTALPVLAATAAGSLGAGQPLAAVGAALGTGLLTAAEAEGKTLAPQVLTTFVNEAVAQATVHPAAQTPTGQTSVEAAGGATAAHVTLVSTALQAATSAS
jgi:hypothetical protein